MPLIGQHPRLQWPLRLRLRRSEWSSTTRRTHWKIARCERSTLNNRRIFSISLSEQPVAWIRAANALTGVPINHWFLICEREALRLIKVTIRSCS